MLGVGITALLYNFGFFTLLAFTPFPLDMNAHQIGLIFFGWSLALTFTSVLVAPLLQHRFGTLITETVMKAAPVERGVASAAYSFLRFGGEAVAPWLPARSARRSTRTCRSGSARVRSCWRLASCWPPARTSGTSTTRKLLIVERAPWIKIKRSR